MFNNPRKSRSLTKLAMLKATQVQKDLSYLESDKLTLIQEEFTSVYEQIGAVTAVNNNLIQSIDLIITRLNSIEESLSTINTDINALKQKDTNIDTVISNINIEISGIKQRLTNLETV